MCACSVPCARYKFQVTNENKYKSTKNKLKKKKIYHRRVPFVDSRFFSDAFPYYYFFCLHFGFRIFFSIGWYSGQWGFSFVFSSSSSSFYQSEVHHAKRAFIIHVAMKRNEFNGLNTISNWMFDAQFNEPIEWHSFMWTTIR